MIPRKSPVFVNIYIYTFEVSENWGYDGKEGKRREHASSLHTLLGTALVAILHNIVKCRSLRFDDRILKM